MQKNSIAKAPLRIGEIIRVIRSQNKKHHKLIGVSNRHSDAFVYILSGSCTYTSNMREMTVKRGDIMYLAHNADYTMYIHDDQYRYIYCDFTFDSDLPRDCMIYTPVDLLSAEGLFIKLLKAYHSDSPARHAELYSILYSIYSVVIRSQVVGYVEKTKRLRVEEAKHYIDSHFMDPSLSISRIARAAEMSEVYFRRLFKEEYGQSPQHYVTSVRLSKAKALMKYPFLTLEECALQSGFSCQQYFCKVFGQQLGITPARYRKSMQHGS